MLPDELDRPQRAGRPVESPDPERNAVGHLRSVDVERGVRFDYPALVAAHSRLLGALSAEIASAIRNGAHEADATSRRPSASQGREDQTR